MHAAVFAVVSAAVSAVDRSLVRQAPQQIVADHGPPRFPRQPTTVHAVVYNGQLRCLTRLTAVTTVIDRGGNRGGSPIMRKTRLQAVLVASGRERPGTGVFPRRWEKTDIQGKTGVRCHNIVGQKTPTKKDIGICYTYFNLRKHSPSTTQSAIDFASTISVSSRKIGVVKNTQRNRQKGTIEQGCFEGSRLPYIFFGCWLLSAHPTSSAKTTAAEKADECALRGNIVSPAAT